MTSADADKTSEMTKHLRFDTLQLFTVKNTILWIFPGKPIKRFILVTTVCGIMCITFMQIAVYAGLLTGPRVGGGAGVEDMTRICDYLGYS